MNRKTKNSRKRKKNSRKRSLRSQVFLMVLFGWLMPVLMILGIMAWNRYEQVGAGQEENLRRQFGVNLKLCADRLNSACEASRLASYDPTIRNAWIRYQSDQNYISFYREARTFLNRQYQSDSRFLYSFFMQEGHEPIININIVSGLQHNTVDRCWEEDRAEIWALADSIDTGIEFLEKDGRVYLIRNLLDSEYQRIGVLALSLDVPYYFEELGQLSWAKAVAIRLDDCQINLSGELPSGDEGIIRRETEGSGYRMTAAAAMDYDVLLSQFAYYRLFLAGMLLLLLVLWPFVFWFMRNKITKPISALMDGAEEVEKGRLGYQSDYPMNSLEFGYLQDSFNQMSAQLRTQFERLYQEELALRDAQIKALQAHINPHFLNNTMEIINWEARLNGDERVSRMIEALGTILDALLDRDRSPIVSLAEEMDYVDAYFYIAQMRYGERLKIEKDIPEELLGCKVPRLILQPVAENAVEHGIRPGETCQVKSRAKKEDEFLLIEISNDGGLSVEDEAHIAKLLSPDYDMRSESGGNIGIANVNTRLRLICGPESGLGIKKRGNEVVASLVIGEPHHEGLSNERNRSRNDIRRLSTGAEREGRGDAGEGGRPDDGTEPAADDKTCGG